MKTTRIFRMGLLTAGVSLASLSMGGAQPAGADGAAPAGGDQFAQVGPPMGGGGGPDDRGGPGGMGGGLGGFDGGPGDMGGPGGPGGDHGPRRGGPMGGPRDPNVQRIELLRNYLDLVDRFTRVSSDPSLSAVSAVITAGDVLRAKGPQSAIDYFEKVLPDVKDPAVERCIRLQLVDLYRASQQPEKALEQTTRLITAAGAPATRPANATR